MMKRISKQWSKQEASQNSKFKAGMMGTVALLENNKWTDDMINIYKQKVITNNDVNIFKTEKKTINWSS